MSNQETPLIEGIRIFNPHQNAPDFVKASIVISPNELFKFLKDQEEFKTEYNGQPQFKMQLLESKQGKLYLKFDTFKPQTQDGSEGSNQNDTDSGDLLF